MAGILMSLGENIAKKHHSLHQDYCKKRHLHSSSYIKNRNYCISKFSRIGENDNNYFTSDEISIFCVGMIYYKEKYGSDAINFLKKEIRENGIEKIVDSLDGHFILVILNHLEKTINVVTDHAGILHAYILKSEDNAFISTSSSVLSKNFHVSVNHDSIAQFLRCDSICDYDTIYNEIKLLKPATIYTYRFGIDSINYECKKTYWKMPISIEKSMSIDEATEKWADTLLYLGRILPKNRAIYDLTGGYDSRSILAGILPYVGKDGNSISTFVFGPENSGEVKVAKNINSKFVKNLIHLDFDNRWNEIFENYLVKALSITDGEENTYNYAPMLYANEDKKKNYSFSVNGMGGVFLKSGNWIQELNIAKKQANISRFIKFHSLQYEYDERIHSHDMYNTITKIDALLESKYKKVIKNIDIEKTYNTIQLDHIRLHQRERRWGGRTISSSNQILNIISPLYFKNVLNIAMSIPPNYKKNGKLIKRVITKLNPDLARERMLSGMPCEEFNMKNFYSFYPSVVVFLKKTSRALSQQLFKRTIFVEESTKKIKKECNNLLFNRPNKLQIKNVENWMTKKLYKKESLNKFIENSTKDGFRYYTQLEKMITLELRLREDNKEIDA